MDCDTTASSPISLVKFRNWPAAVVSRLSTAPFRKHCARWAIRKPDRGDRGLCRRPRQPQPGARHQPSSLKAKGFTDEKIGAVNAALKSAFDIKFVFQPVDSAPTG